MLAVICSILVPPLLYRFGLIGFETEPGGWSASPSPPARLSWSANCSTSPCSTGCAGKPGGARRCSPRWRARCSTRAIFFTRRLFAAAFAFVGPDDAFALEPAPLFGVIAASAPRWVSWAVGDLAVKLHHRRVRAHPLPADRGTLGPTAAGRGLASPRRANNIFFNDLGCLGAVPPPLAPVQSCCRRLCLTRRSGSSQIGGRRNRRAPRRLRRRGASSRERR